MKRKHWLFLGVFIFIVGSISYNRYLDRQDGDDIIEKDNFSNSKSMAYIMSQNFVEQQLKAPSTAKFAKYYEVESKMKIIATNKYYIISYVDAQNSFGAMIRNYYSCDMTDLGDGKWRCENLVIE